MYIILDKRTGALRGVSRVLCVPDTVLGLWGREDERYDPALEEKCGVQSPGVPQSAGAGTKGLLKLGGSII